MSQIFHYQLTILERHIDTLGHVNNATYLQIFEEARWDFITKNNYGLKEVLQHKIGPVILKAKVVFRRELFNREVITIESSFHGMKNPKVMILEQKMIKQNGDVASEAKFEVGVMDLAERKLIPPTPEWLNACGVSI